MSIALITGITGQDGSYLAELLHAKNYRVIGVLRNLEKTKKTVFPTFNDRLGIVEWDMLNQHSIVDIIKKYQPTEIYNLAAYSSGSGMFDDPVGIGEINGLAVTRILEAIRKVDTNIKFCQASSREVFGEAVESPQTESTPVNPRSPYGSAKLYADSMVRIYREHYNMFTCSAILFNHESPRRGMGFVTRKITYEAARIKLGLSKELHLGNLDAQRDWGFAGDYVRALWLMLQQESPQDYVIATGEAHTVREFCQVAFSRLGLDYNDHVKEDALISRSVEPMILIGSAVKANNNLLWKPEVNFKELVHMMVDEDLKILVANIKNLKRKSMYKKIDKCRICGNTHLECVLDLGEQMLTGVFPREKNANVTTGPLRLVKCVGGSDVCGLLQMEHSYDLGEMYGENYGYRSGLNASMVAHLNNKVRRILELVELHKGDLVIDIGSNDSTTLQAYPSSGSLLVGIDPTGTKFHSYYPSHIQLIPDFFTSSLVKERFPGLKAKVVTSFSMFYDLEDPMEFMRQVYEVLADKGIWVFEQSYMPTMLDTNSYDTVCHEHLEFYALRQIKWMADKVGFKILDVEFNDINGGSFSLTVAKAHGDLTVIPSVQKILDDEHTKGLETLAPYQEFAERVVKTRRDLLSFIKTAHSENKSISALGASTKGNVLLQYCNLSTKEFEFVGEVNPEKFGCYTPGTWIPIISEQDLLVKKPDYLIILPWHFKQFFTSNKKFSGMNLVFPLPKVEVIRVA